MFEEQIVMDTHSEQFTIPGNQGSFIEYKLFQLGFEG